MAPTIKLTYFDAKARGEATRLALHVGNTKFEDERVTEEAFSTLKSELPFGMLPVLTVDGTKYAESNAMLRYAGKLGGLYPRAEKDALKVDMVVDALEPVLTGLFADSSKEGRDKYVAEVIPQFVGAIDKIYGETKGTFLLGNKMTIADIKLMTTLEGLNEGEQFDHVPAGVLDKYKNVIEARKAVAENEKVKAWYAKKGGDEVTAEEKKTEPRTTFFSKVFKRRGKKTEETAEKEETPAKEEKTGKEETAAKEEPTTKEEKAA